MKWRNIELSVILVVSAGLLFLAAGCCRVNHDAEDTPKTETPRFVIKSTVAYKEGSQDSVIREMTVIEDTQGINDFLVIARFNGGITMMPIGRTNTYRENR